SAPRRNLWWLAPPVAALFYPMALRALYESGALLQRASGPKAATAWLAIVASVALVYSVPVLGIVVADRLGRAQTTSSPELFARRLSHLVVAAPSIFVLMGVVFFLLHAPNGDVLCWSIVWLIAIASMARTMRRGGDEALAPSTPNPIPLRMAHGCSALAIVLIFLVWHLLNHASAALSLQVEEAMMSALRQWYRSEYVQPVLVVLMLFQLGSGLILLRRATAARSDIYRTLQTSTGAFLTAFIASHLNSVFVYARAVTKVDTTFLWASGAPAGLLHDPWNVRLIPHYSLAGLFVVIHMGLGLRGVLLAHQVQPLVADRAARAIGAPGTALPAI